MEAPMKEIKEHVQGHSSKKALIILLVTGGVLVVGILFGLFAYTKSYTDKTLPGLTVGDISLGKMSREELSVFLSTMSDKLTSDGIQVDIKYATGTYSFTIIPELVTDANVFEFLTLDTEKETERLLHYGKTGNIISDALALLRANLTEQHLTLQNIQVDRERLEAALQEKIVRYEVPPQEARLTFRSFDPVLYAISPSKEGFVYTLGPALETIEKNFAEMKPNKVTLEAQVTMPEVTENDLRPLVSTIPAYIEAGPLSLEQTDTQLGIHNKWKISVANFASWMTVSEESNPNHFTLDKASTTAYLQKYIAPDIEVAPENAKFSVESSGKVKEFQAARTGVSLDTEASYTALKLAFESRLMNSSSTSSVQIVVKQVEPTIGTSEVNNLGIKEILGVGVSNFSGSPSNRIKNIRNAVNKLNGTLIPPGEEFSAIKYTQPYTLEGGYLPEKVIKGDEIKPEIGGGLCQVGTTLFRMAMNSGMDITERRNHSLVVSYYNDPSNNMPGTDATIYDPAPDFRFKNDTNNYILIQSFMNDKTGDLRFTIWGTNDGRKGSYTKPVVHSWIAPGPAKLVETLKLAPGVKECQHAYQGANTSFTYTRVMPDGTQQNRVFESHYRALPQICLVGVKDLVPPCPEGQICEVLPPSDNSELETPSVSNNLPFPTGTSR